MDNSEKDYLTTRDTATRLDVSASTIRHWIKRGWLVAESTIPQTTPGPAKRMVGRYHVDGQAVAAIEQQASSMQNALLKYVPREHARQKRRAASNAHQPTLPGLDEAETQ